MKKSKQQKKQLCRVTFYAHPREAVEEMYLCGENHASGLWDASSATKMKPTEQGFRAIKVLPVGEPFEFKVLRTNDWSGVEKGVWNEEIPNHVIVAYKGLVVDMDIPSFRKD
ncbi:MAG: hypothetical protein II896_04110 [Clostridia bacterium]|nr:hypothetical protein [Clostridia bacterium]